MGSRQGRAGAAHDLWRSLCQSGAERRSLLSECRSFAGLRASRNRAARQPQAAAARGELPSILVGAVRPAAGAARGAVLSTADHRRAAERRRRHAAGLLRPAARFSASKAPEVSTLRTTPTKNLFT